MQVIDKVWPKKHGVGSNNSEDKTYNNTKNSQSFSFRLSKAYRHFVSFFQIQQLQLWVDRFQIKSLFVIKIYYQYWKLGIYVHFMFYWQRHQSYWQFGCHCEMAEFQILQKSPTLCCQPTWLKRTEEQSSCSNPSQVFTLTSEEQ